MGLGTLLITELPRQPEQAAADQHSSDRSLCGWRMCWHFICPGGPADLCQFLVSEFKYKYYLTFCVGVSLTSITMVLDQALIGLLKGNVQLWRNGLFALGKLIVLFLVSHLFLGKEETTIYATWVVGDVVSLLPLVALVILKKKTPGRSYRHNGHYCESWASQHYSITYST